MKFIPGKPVTYTQGEVCALSGSSGSQMEHWVRSGIIIPAYDSIGRGVPRRFSLENIPQAAIARQLTAAGFSIKQLRTTFSQLHERVAALPPSLRASATFVRFVEMVDAIVTINGPGPNYTQWRKDVEAFLRRWHRRPAAPLDTDILQMLAAARTAEAAEETRGVPA